ncbi:hypothetical protein [Escherichia coli]|uniref:hypothetical protein n=1 Tax=Escherichia coli TaxID=562 RepID=UPI0022AF2046|nr:hypothetical protein [Escherichia coli]MCZ4233243.1 hypothetical protein [Escherichia coli]
MRRPPESTRVRSSAASDVYKRQVHNDETSIGKFGLAYKSNIQRKLDNQYYTEAEASLARGRISGAENIVKNDAAHFCVTQGKKMQIVKLKTEGAGLHGVARLTFKCGE